MNNSQYREMVDDTVNRLPGAWNGRIKQLPVANNAPLNFALQFPPGDPLQGVQLIYRTRDIYILGYVALNGTSYVTHDQIANVPGATSLGFKGDYKSLGWDRKSTLTVNKGGPDVHVARLNIALANIANGAAAAGDLCVLAIALAEAVRFMDVEKAVRNITPVTTEMVDWDQQLASGNAVLRPG